MTGTSSEYLGLRPLRRILRDRYLVVVMGPRGSGKTSVAMRIVGQDGDEPVRLDTKALQQEVVERARTGAWPPALIEAPALVLDGPVFLRTRPAVVGFLRELVEARRVARRRTAVCEVAQDGSIALLMADLPAGVMATVGLRFPQSRSGRMRFARRMCDHLGLARSAAHGTEAIDPWGYEAVVAALQAKVREAVSGK